MMYDCPCGKKHKSRNTVSKHKKKLSLRTSSEDGGQDRGQGKGQDSAGHDQRNSPPLTQGQSFVKEISLKGEFDRMTETINPKDKKPDEPKYQCGACGGKFDEKYKRCPHCGAEF